MSLWIMIAFYLFTKKSKKKLLFYKRQQKLYRQEITNWQEHTYLATILHVCFCATQIHLSAPLQQINKEEKLVSVMQSINSYGHDHIDDSPLCPDNDCFGACGFRY